MLVSSVRDPSTTSLDAGEDLIGGLGPDERLGPFVGEGDVLEDRGLQGVVWLRPQRAAIARVL
jgi:hypothetical protein